MKKLVDLTPPIIYKDEETGEVVTGGEDSPEINALREANIAGTIQMTNEQMAEHNADDKQTETDNVNRAEAPNPAPAKKDPLKPWTEEDYERMCTITPDDVQAAREKASPKLRSMLDAKPDDSKEG